MPAWPDWWTWELELSPHVLKRMLDRRFSEVDLRHMMERALGLTRCEEPDRWMVDTRHDNRSWQVLVEPDPLDRMMVVITAYPVDVS